MDISKPIITLLKSKPFYGHFIASMKVHETTEIPTAGVNVDKKINLFINPEFWNKLPLNHQVGVLEHEVAHILYLHLLRGQSCIHDAYNIASDCAINEYIGVDNLPSTALFPEKLGMKRYQTSEFYYNFLTKSKRDIKWGMNVAGAASAAGKGRKGANKNAPAKTDKNKGNEKAHRGTLDDHSIWDKGNKDEDYVKEKIRGTVNKVCDVLDAEGKGIGNLPSAIQEVIKRLRKKPMDWRLILRRFIHHATYTVTVASRKKRNRRFGIVFPGTKTDPVLKMAVGIDTSGSISEYQLSQFMNEVTGIKSAVAELWIITCDAIVHDVYKYNKKEGLRPIQGRGGTAFQPVLTKAEELNVDALCYLTDGYNGDTIKKPTYPVLWAITRDGQRPVPWGTVISLKDEKERTSDD